jgi:hypothetical protein
MTCLFKTPLFLRHLSIGIVLLTSITTVSIGQQLNNPFASFHDHKEFIIGLDNRITHLNGKFGVIYGLYTGIGYGENLRLKLGISGTPFEVGKHSPEKSTNEVGRILFATIGQEFDFLTIHKFKLTTYVNGGFGYHFYRILDPEKAELDKGVEHIFPVETGLHVRYQISEIFAFKTGGGWRFVFPEHGTNLGGYYIKLTAVINPKKLKAYLHERKERKKSS